MSPRFRTPGNRKTGRTRSPNREIERGEGPAPHCAPGIKTSACAQIVVTLAKAVDGIARGLVLFHKEVFHAVVRGGAKNPGEVQYPVADFAESAGGHRFVELDRNAVGLVLDVQQRHSAGVAL